MKARYLAFYKETVAGVFPTSPTPLWPRLIGDDAFNVLETPQTADITSMEVNNRVIDVESTRRVIQGKLNSFLYMEQAEAILDWALKVDSTSGELPSYSCRYFDGIDYFEYNGIYVSGLELSSAAETEEGIWKLSLDLIGIRPAAVKPDGTSFPMPALTVYPTARLKLIDTKGKLVIDDGTTARTKYRSLAFKLKNNLSGNWDEDKYLSDVTYHGRTASLEGDFRYVSTEDRTWFEGLTPLKAKFSMEQGTSPAKKTLLIDLRGNCRISQLDRSQPLAKPGYNKMTVRSIIDPATSDDITYSVTTS